MNNNHFFHLVSFSPWPLLFSLNVINLGMGLVFFMADSSLFCFYGSAVFFVVVICQWWRDVIREGFYEGAHTLMSTSGMSLGIVGFIVSELCFFLSFFWMYFYCSLNPDVNLGSVWPPMGLVCVDFMDVPFLNTLILVGSGFFITWSHFSFFLGAFFKFFISYTFCLLLGFYFLFIQYYEYYNFSCDFTDGIFGCSFYILTGFHGFHVILGVVFMFVMFIRSVFNHFSIICMSGYEYSVWYWHFVDVVWLFLYLFIYWWGM